MMFLQPAASKITKIHSTNTTATDVTPYIQSPWAFNILDTPIKYRNDSEMFWLLTKEF